VRAGKSALIVGPTWSEIGAITGFVKSEGRLDREENTDLTIHAGSKDAGAEA